MSGAAGFPSGAASLLRELIRIPSVNPHGEPGTDRTGEEACARYVGGILEACGAAVRFEEVLPGRPNVIGTFSRGTGKKKPRLLFAPHTDTVGVGGMTIDPFGGEIRDGRVYGRGASDTKGTMAAMLWAFYELRDSLPELGVEVTFAGFMGEETGQPGSCDFAKRYGGDYDFAIIGEPTDLNIVHTCKGCLWIEIETRGVAAHGATPERGTNAITRMARIIDGLDTRFREQLGARSDPVLGRSTINIGMCHGGTRANIVADRCSALLDLRITPGLGNAGARALLETFLKRYDSQIALRTVVDCSPLATDPAHPMIRRLLEIPIRRAAGAGAPVLKPAPWFCDAAVLAAAGIPSIALGPGSIAQAHTVDEFLAVADLEAGADFYRRFLESFGTE